MTDDLDSVIEKFIKKTHEFENELDSELVLTLTPLAHAQLKFYNLGYRMAMQTILGLMNDN